MHAPKHIPFTIPTSTNDVYPNNRAVAFRTIESAFDDAMVRNHSDTLVACGDSLELLRRFPSQSIDLIVTDPPYHSTKKPNIYGDSTFGTDYEYIDWMNSFFSEFHRILRPNGSLYLFCSAEMAPFLYVELHRQFNMHNLIAWSKPNEPGYDGWKQKMNKRALRTWYPHSERIIFASPAYPGNLKRTLFGQFLRDQRKRAGLTSNQLTELVGAYGRVNNGGAVSNWETGRNIPSRTQYDKISHVLKTRTGDSVFPAYEDVIRAFSVDPSRVFIDVWDHFNVRQHKGKHPAEKPLDLLCQIIETSSYEGDIVLDCFAGSGAVGVASRMLKRKSINLEIDPQWAQRVAYRCDIVNGSEDVSRNPNYGGYYKRKDDKTPRFL